MTTYSFDRGTQRAILSVILRDPVFSIDYRSAIQPSFFDDPFFGTICRIALEFVDKFSKPPTLQVLESEISTYVKKFARTDDDYARLRVLLAELYQPSATSDDDYARSKAIAFAKHQGLKQGIREAAKLLNEADAGSLEPGSAHLRARRILTNSLEIGSDGFRDIGISLGDEYKRLPKILQRDYLKSKVIPTGIPILDRIMKGGLGRGEVGVVVGPRKRGKSTVLCNFGAAAAFTGHFVVHITLELKKADVVLVYSCRITGLSDDEVMAMDAAKLNQYNTRMRHWFTGGGGVQVVYARPGRADTDWIRSYLSRLQQVHGRKVDCLILDYMDRLRMKKDNMYLAGGSVMEDFVAIGDDFDAAVWTASQTGRHSVRKDFVGGEDTAESFRKIMDADIAIILNQSAQQKRDGEINLFIDSHRRGIGDVFIPCTIDYARKYLKQVQPKVENADDEESTVTLPKSKEHRDPEDLESSAEAYFRGVES